MSGLPRIAYLAAGGTIASGQITKENGVVPSLTASELLNAVPQVNEIAEISTVQVLQKPSPSLDFVDLEKLLAIARDEVRQGAAGVVISHGSDTIEETAYYLDLRWSEKEPLIITGAMRNPTLPGADGPANLLAAIRTAASPSARDLGVLVVLNEQIHAARAVCKIHTFAASTFASPSCGPLGWVVEDQAIIRMRVPRFPSLEIGASMPPVALTKIVLADDGRILPVLPELGFAGVVVEAMGGGHVPEGIVKEVVELAAAIPVILCSRAIAGEVLRNTYGFGGGEMELIANGLIPAGVLGGLKARLLLIVLLSKGISLHVIKSEFEARGY